MASESPADVDGGRGELEGEGSGSPGPEVSDRGLDYPRFGYSDPLHFEDLGLTASVSGFEILDYDGDGRSDIAFAGSDTVDGKTYFGTVLVSHQGGGGSFSTPQSKVEPQGRSLFSPFFADMDGDGRADATCGSFRDRIILFHQNVDGRLAEVASMAEHFEMVWRFDVADFDLDGWLDVGASDVLGDKVCLYRQQEDGSFAVDSSFEGIGLANDVRLGDLDGDAYPDLSIARAFGCSVFFQSADGFSDRSLDLDYDSYVLDPLLLSDVDGNGLLDLVLGRSTGSYFAQAAPRRFLDVDYLLEYDAYESPSVLALGDLNDDGRTDVFFGSNDRRNLVISLQGEQGEFLSRRVIAHNFGHPYLVKIRDLDGDGVLDLLAASALFERSDVAAFFGRE